jgi:broad specificity phosphatase PhoE
VPRVFIIRHGKPSGTWGEGFDDDPGLDAAGKAQAELASRALLTVPEEFRAKRVVSSPLRRCRETAAPFAHALGVELEIDAAFGEIPTPRGVARADREAWLRTAFAGRWDEIEGDIDYVAWQADVVRALTARPGTAVFSHYVAINAVVSAVTANPAVLAFRPDHASISTFDVGAGELSLVELGRQALTGVH